MDIMKDFVNVFDKPELTEDEQYAKEQCESANCKDVKGEQNEK